MKGIRESQPEMNNARVELTTSERSLLVWEIASVTVSVLIAEWLVLPFTNNNRLLIVVPVGLAFGLILLSHRVRHESAREIGWRLDNFGRAARLLALPMLLAAIVLVGIGLMIKGLHFEKESFWGRVLWLPLWGLLQQYVLQGFINRRAQTLLQPGWSSILLVALIFALLHLPNLWLSLATFTGGLLWAYVYQRAPNLPALALSHALMSMLLASVAPLTTLHSLRVGIKYFG
jgi:membrane protease YdiL (CAAX protease family)